MSRTYVGYQERDPSRAIDWNSIAKDINDRLSQEVDRRENLKAELDEMTREVQEAAANAPMSKSTVLNQWVIDGVSNIGEMNYTLNRELKGGRLNPQDFVRRTQRLMDGYSNIEALATNWGSVYNEKLERMLSGSSSHLERELMEFTEGLVNFDNSGIFTTEDGRVVIAKKETDAQGNYTGKLSKSDVVDLNVLRGIVDFKADRYNLDEDMTTMAANFASKWEREKGMVTWDDIRKNPEYDNAVSTLIKSRLENSQTAAMDILMETGLYGTTRDQSNTNANTIVLKPNENGIPVPALTDAQMREASRIAREVFETRLKSSRLEDEPVRYQPTSDEIANRIKRGEDKDKAYALLEVLQRAKSMAPDDPGFDNVEAEIRGLVASSLGKGEMLSGISVVKEPGTGSSAGRLVISYSKKVKTYDPSGGGHSFEDVQSDPIILDFGDDIGNLATAFAPYIGLDVSNSIIREQVRNLDDVDAFEFKAVDIDPSEYSDLRTHLMKTGRWVGALTNNKRGDTISRLNDMFRSLDSKGAAYAGELKAEESGKDIVVTDTDGNEVAVFKYGSASRNIVFDRLIQAISDGGRFRYSGLEGNSTPTNLGGGQNNIQQGAADVIYQSSSNE